MEMTTTRTPPSGAANRALATDLPFPPQYGTELLILKSGKGVWLRDAAGKKYLDFAGGIAVNALGYGRRDLARAAMKQMRRLPHVSNLFTTEPALELARAMLSREPGRFASVFFGNSGTEANEAALKYARLHAFRTRGPGHEKLLCFSGAFHGRTLGSLSCTPSPKYQDPYAPLLPGVVVSAFNDCASLERTLTAEFAGVIVEVVQGEGGLTCMTPEFAAALNQACARTGAILIADEVQTGMARTGTFYGSEGIGLKPDLITLAKPLGGGLPLSAVLIPEKINAVIHASDHGTTFGGGPVTTAVAKKVWDTVGRPEFVRAVAEKSEVLEQGLQDIRSAFPRKVGELRGRGFLRGFEYKDGEVAGFLQTLRERGMLALRSGTNVVRIAPPLVITEKEIQMGIALMKEALK